MFLTLIFRDSRLMYQLVVNKLKDTTELFQSNFSILQIFQLYYKQLLYPTYTFFHKFFQRNLKEPF